MFLLKDLGHGSIGGILSFGAYGVIAGAEADVAPAESEDGSPGGIRFVRYRLSSSFGAISPAEGRL